MAYTPAKGLAGVIGAGLVTTLGRGCADHARALDRAPPEPRPVPLDELEAGLEVPYLPAAWGHRDLNAQIDAALAEALDEARLNARQLHAAGLFIGTSSVEIGALEAEYAEQLQRHEGGERPLPLTSARSSYGGMAASVGARHGIHGPNLTFSTACSSSANALAHAARAIDAGWIEHAVVLGTEAFNRLSLLGFASLMLVSREAARPFDRDRDGLVLGEGVGALVLGPSQHTARWRVSAAANRCDTSSATNSEPDKIAAVMTDALAGAGLDRSDVRAVKAHGTSTVSNDRAEAAALELVFGEAVPPFISMKGHLGHTLGACGVIELAALRSCVETGFLPATGGFAQPDPELKLAPCAEPTAVGAGRYLLNYFGFGGNNTSLLMDYRP